ncbi:phloem protein 2-like protein [Artemisia annua]|uniref:Phloem protein 2-like protein n=1 Tax=Artemisia annua TaxID=35608 RepID=A0A2U1P6X9_ARTAN|nr:phloem protein 2-like protein [Artemisia annua]
MKRSENDVPTRTKEELDKLHSTGVLIDNGEKFFSLSKINCKKCHMLPAKAVINKSPDAKFIKCPSSTMSRFEEVVELQRHQAFSINYNIKTKMLSPDTAYAYKRVPDHREDGWMEVRVWEFDNNNEIKDIPMELKLSCLGGTMSGLTVSGIEFRPL